MQNMMTNEAFIVQPFHFHIHPPGLCDGFRQPPLQLQAVVTTCTENLDLHVRFLSFIRRCTVQRIFRSPKIYGAAIC
jgi:hypothetical protein